MMAQRIPIAPFVSFLRQQVDEGAGYIMGSTGENPRTGYRDLEITKCKPAWEPDGWLYRQYKDARQYNQAIYWRNHSRRVFDCQGLAEGYYDIIMDANLNTRARNNYAEWCDPKGFGMIPAKYRVPGAAVFWSDSSATNIHHAAYLVEPITKDKQDGDWWIIEAAGVMSGVVSSRLYARKPNFWGWMTKYFNYGSDTAQADDTALLGGRTLRNGDEGEDVRTLQKALIELGYDLGKWGADGDFGDATELAVRAFQRDAGLEADGIAGRMTADALERALAEDRSAPANPAYVAILGGNCYIRETPGLGGKVLGVAMAGAKLPYGGETDADTEWLKVVRAGQPGWVGPKYGKLVGGDA
jgi:hypothetical protein